MKGDGQDAQQSITSPSLASAGEGWGGSAAAFAPVIADGHQFQFLPTGAAAIDAVQALIDTAEHSVALEMYIYKNDATGARIRSALIGAAQRGVRVRILLDDFGSSELPKDFFAALVKLGGELRMFNPSPLLRFAFRNHRKLCVVDDATAIVGGFNIGDEYAGDGIERGWRDLGMQVHGPLAFELTVSFDRMFIASRMDRAAFIVFARGLRPRLPSLDRPSLLTSGPGFGGALMRRALYRDLKIARLVYVISSYFAPTWMMRRHLLRAARHGNVQLILPSKSDVPLLRLAGQHLYRRMLEDGVRVFEYEPQILHAKLLVADNIVYVGSCNLDARSLRLNFELLLRIPLTAVADQARQLIAADTSRSRNIGLDEWLRSDSGWQRFKRQVAYWLVTRLDPLLARRRLRAMR